MVGCQVWERVDGQTGQRETRETGDSLSGECRFSGGRQPTAGTSSAGQNNKKKRKAREEVPLGQNKERLYIPGNRKRVDVPAIRTTNEPL